MAEVCIKVPDDLKMEIEESDLDLSSLIKEFIKLKLFEQRISDSKALQRLMFNSIVSKSKLAEEDAKRLADKIDEGMLRSLKEKYPEL